MSIRLNKAIRELNIGLNTAVEFLSKIPELGKVKPDPSCKISDEQYNALSTAFTKDKEVRNKAEQLKKTPKRSKSRKAPKETLEERHKRNGDKNVEMGYSSTGVPLPTAAQMKSHKKRKPFVRFIQVPMGGKSNRY